MILCQRDYRVQKEEKVELNLSPKRARAGSFTFQRSHFGLGSLSLVRDFHAEIFQGRNLLLRVAAKRITSKENV